MSKKFLSTLIPIFLFSNILLSQNNFSKFVNPFIGTGGHGHTFPGAIVPFGMVQLSPDTRIDGSWDGCSGYHYSDSVIYGFSHTHLNGTGVSDYGDILLMPTMGEVSLDNKKYSSTFSHKNEKASAGFYEVLLDKNNINVKLTTTTRVGFHEYTFNKSGKANIILDLNHRDELLEGEVKIIDHKTIEVFRRSKAWAQNQYIYARIEFSKPMLLSKIKNDNKNATINDKIFEGKVLALAFSNQVKAGEKIKVKVSLSLTGYEGAEKNMLAEGQSWDFNKIKNDAEKYWDKELSKIEVSSSDKDKKTIFYTALYHAFTQPNIANDVDGKYRGRDNQIHKADQDYYTVFSLWDTFRAYHPLMTLIDKKRTSDFINTFILEYEQGKRLPIWELASNETYCMIGYHSVAVIAEAMKNGVKGFDYEKAFEAAKNSANLFDDFGMKTYRENGFLTIDDEHESVSKTLEYAYDDWCIAQMAKILNKKEDYESFMKRSQGWKNLFDFEQKFIRPKLNGDWLKPFDPKEISNNFTEGNAWQYTFFVPQNIPEMIKFYGGNNAFEKKLDQLFSETSKTTGRTQVDVTGLIGQYAQGNEPSHHVAYLYNYIGKPEKTKKKVHFILNNFYKNSPDGLIGNEDCGQMSSWFVLSSLGMYKITPGSTTWETVEPFFIEEKIHLENGETLHFKNKKDIDNWDKTQDSSEDKIITNEKEIVIVPLISFKNKTFETEEVISIKSFQNYPIFYSIDSGDFQKYNAPFTINKSSIIKAFTENDNHEKSTIITSKVYKKPNNYEVKFNSKPDLQYFSGGKQGLIDGVFGDSNWKKGDWQGYQSQDFEVVIDMKKSKEISTISADFLQDTRSWILMPTKAEFFISDDGKNFKKMGEINSKTNPQDYNIQIEKLAISFVKTNTRYIKIIAKNFGKLPEWHQGFPSNGDAYIFVDEVEIK
ncbi:GH92 family glycosyl hydrolase [Halpernia sp.]|uniref:GH92 family glycosyl hydrolase n=1 Tax=Halpernia sp. TaxID=2782209 RepID=UPI003A8E4154